MYISNPNEIFTHAQLDLVSPQTLMPGFRGELATFSRAFFLFFFEPTSRQSLTVFPAQLLDLCLISVKSCSRFSDFVLLLCTIFSFPFPHPPIAQEFFCCLFFISDFTELLQCPLHCGIGVFIRLPRGSHFFGHPNDLWFSFRTFLAAFNPSALFVFCQHLQFFHCCERRLSISPGVLASSTCPAFEFWPPVNGRGVPANLRWPPS